MSTSGKYIKGLVGVLILFAAAGICHGEIDAQKQLEFADGLFHRGFHSEAIAEYEEYLSQVPAGADATTAWLRLGRSAVVIGQYEKALTAFQHAKEGAGSLEQRLEAQVSCGEALFFLNRYVEVIAALKSSVEGSADPETRARALYYMGRAYLEADD
ncbi:MAG: hypothetical protein KAH38_09160, partial [Candidatus Hydrogenedentes bacterium]|nr:hypothetical protein [Candidatus Hydrogenedentota bacterium]